MAFFAAALSGSTIQWVVARGVYKKGIFNKNNQYNVIVYIAAASSMTLTLFNFISYHYAPPQAAYTYFLVINWMVSTHSSIMLVSRRLSVCYVNSDRVWKRLLLVNLFMAPVSILVLVSWAGAQQSDEGSIFRKMSTVIEPIQIALWGVVEFCLSGWFIVKMWKFQWTKVERRGIIVLLCVGLCDVASVTSNILVGDRASTVVKGFVYCLRIRLEVNVLVVMSNFL